MTDDFLNKLPKNFLDSSHITSREYLEIPREIIEQLKISPPRLDDLIIELFNKAPELSVDKILVGIWYGTQKTYTRNNIISKLNRLMKKSVIYSIPGKKGVYSLIKYEGHS